MNRRIVQPLARASNRLLGASFGPFYAAHLGDRRRRRLQAEQAAGSRQGGGGQGRAGQLGPDSVVDKAAMV